MPHRPVLILLALSLAGATLSAQLPAGVAPIPPPPDVKAPPPDATKTESGLASRILEQGTGEQHPGVEDFVTVHYTGWTTDGRMFDSSHARNAPSTFPISRVVKGWGEGVMLMVVGEKRRLWIPEDLAYGGQDGRPRGMLVFDVELLEIRQSPTIPPADVAAPPDDASRTPSGLAYKVLKPGQGTGRPGRGSRVTVHYSGWTTDGKLFDSSLMRGAPATFALDQVIAGWTEGVALMTVGERTRFWIPERLAYKGQPGSPRGMLVFDVELIAIPGSR
jgi:FKBP-type peptidyl-prolyl cis-trans isomerase